MSTYAYPGFELGITPRPKHERPVHITFEQIITGEVPVYEIKPEMVPPEVIVKLKEDIVIHLLVKASDEIRSGNYPRHIIDQLEEGCREEVEAIIEINSKKIDQETLTWLIQKARSFDMEQADYRQGNAYQDPRPELVGVVERVRYYTGEPTADDSLKTHVRM